MMQPQAEDDGTRLQKLEEAGRIVPWSAGGALPTP